MSRVTWGIRYLADGPNAPQTTGCCPLKMISLFPGCTVKVRMRAAYPIALLCEPTEVSRRGYQFLKGKQEKKADPDFELISKEWVRHVQKGQISRKEVMTLSTVRASILLVPDRQASPSAMSDR